MFYSTMKNPLLRHRRGAFTLVELLVVIAIISLLAALLMPALQQGEARAKRIGCVSDLREIGLANHLFANDHTGKFPTQVSTNDGGSLEFVTAGEAVQNSFYFSYQLLLPLIGSLTTPRLAACPSDLQRWAATNFTQFNNWNVSYAIGVKADPGSPGAILAADRNFPSYKTAAYTPNPTIGIIGNPVLAQWGTDLHIGKGNVLFADDHVEESYNAIIPSEETVDNFLFYPDVIGSLGSTFGGGSGGSPAEGGSPGSPVQSTPYTGPRVSPYLQNSFPLQPGNPSTYSQPTAPSTPATLRPAMQPAGQMLPSFNRHPVVATAPLSAPMVTIPTSNPVARETRVVTNLPAVDIIATNTDSVVLSPANQKVVHYLRCFFGWLFLILLLLLLFELSRRFRRAKEKASRNRRRPK